ncbi:MAG: radical SAM protein [Anaerolineae bacterium]|jgi:MoaA/NifB/PqqE/SkfB family radical SAM enzyme
MSLFDAIKSWFTPHKPLSKEIVHYQTPPDADTQYRLHLRIEPDGRGLLVVNAATVLHLNQTAAEYARMLIQDTDDEEVAKTIAKRYRVGKAQALEDYEQLREHIITLATTVDLDPVTYLGLERTEPFSAESSAPYRADLALTYRLDKSGALDPGARKRVDRELSTEEWQQVLDKLWEVGVPHVCFTGGEPTLREDLVELVAYAEKLGQVTGLLTNGCCLQDQAYLNQLLLAGLDHLQITLASHQAEAHDHIVGVEGAWEQATEGLRNAIAGDIYVVVHIIVTPENADTVTETVNYLAEAGVPAIALSSPLKDASEEQSQKLQKALEEAQSAVYAQGMTLVWDLATPYSRVNPIETETEISSDQVVRQHLYIEPDGDALPAQGHNVVLGNILRDPWEVIWERDEAFQDAHSA